MFCFLRPYVCVLFALVCHNDFWLEWYWFEYRNCSNTLSAYRQAILPFTLRQRRRGGRWHSSQSTFILKDPVIWRWKTCKHCRCMRDEENSSETRSLQGPPPLFSIIALLFDCQVYECDENWQYNCITQFVGSWRSLNSTPFHVCVSVLLSSRWQ